MVVYLNSYRQKPTSAVVPLVASAEHIRHFAERIQNDYPEEEFRADMIDKISCIVSEMELIARTLLAYERSKLDIVRSSTKESPAEHFDQI